VIVHRVILGFSKPRMTLWTGDNPEVRVPGVEKVNSLEKRVQSGGSLLPN
jgi:hypothetical protein